MVGARELDADREAAGAGVEIGQDRSDALSQDGTRAAVEEPERLGVAHDGDAGHDALGCGLKPLHAHALAQAASVGGRNVAEHVFL
jgi:hypothetical protein